MKKTLSIAIALTVIFSLPFGKGRGWAQNISINTTGAPADATSLLEIGKGTLATPDVLGLLIPRVNLTITTSNAPIGVGIVTSLLVYNNATVNDVTPGYYYWNGTKWVAMVSSTLEIKISFMLGRISWKPRI